MYLVYCWTNRNNGKQYIGQTCQSLAKRVSVHVADAKRGKTWKLSNAIRKHTIDAFDIVVLSTVETKNEADALERRYILEKETYLRDKGYNLTMGGDAPVFTEEAKQKIRERTPRGPKHHQFGKPMPKYIREAALVAMKKKAALRRASGQKGYTPVTAGLKGKNSPSFKQSVDNDELIAMYQAGEYVSKIANKFDVAEATVYRRARAAGVLQNRMKKYQEVSTAEVAELYLSGLGMNKVGAKLGVTKPCIKRHLKLAGVEPRRTGRPQKAVN